MSRKFISTVLAASMAVTAFTAMPARAASEQDIARLLAGAATIFIITKAIQSSRDNDRDDSDRDRVVIRNDGRHDRDGRYDRDGRHDRDGRYDRDDRHDRGDRDDRNERGDRRHRDRLPAALPQGCAVRARTGGGYETFYGARCLDRHYRSAQRLPGECLREVRSYQGERQAYSGSCLRRRGYSVAGR